MAKKNAERRKRAKSGSGSSAGRSPAGKNGGLGFYLFLGAVAVAGVAWLFLAGNGDGASETQPLSVADMEAEASGAAGVAMGPEDAPVTIIEFADFRCPACRQFNSMQGRLLRQNYATGDDAILRWVAYDFPIFGQASYHPAVAARCAEDQGRFWEMHDLLYARTESWYNESNPNGAFLDLAEVLGLDTNEFRECLRERPHLQDVAASRKYGESLGVGATPTLYLNGRPLDLGRHRGYAALEQQVLAAAEAAGAAEAAAEAEADAADDLEPAAGQ